MNIVCKNCKSENPLGSIFCRTCGNKLDIERLDKEIKKYRKHKNILNRIKAFFRFLILVFFLAILYIAFQIFDPFNFYSSTNQVLTNQGQTTAVTKYNNIRLGTPGNYSFTKDQLSFIASQYFRENKNDLSVTLLQNKYIGFTITKTLFSYDKFKLNFKVTAVCELVMTSDNFNKSRKLKVNFKYLKLGNLTLPKMYNQFFMDEFKPYENNRKINSLREKIQELEINKDLLTVTVGN